MWVRILIPLATSCCSLAPNGAPVKIIELPVAAEKLAEEAITSGS
jgi:hypothetical protein